MSASLFRRTLVGGLFSLVAVAALAEAPVASLRPVARAPATQAELSTRGPVLRPTLGRILDGTTITGTIGAVVVDVATGATLEERGADVPLPPASVTKTLTTLYALDALGPDHRFDTRLIATGPVADGVLRGDLILAGGGDPTLDTDDLAALALDLKAAGVSEVTGRFLVHAGALPEVAEIDPTQMDHLDYNPAISGLNLNFNRVHFTWARTGDGYAVTLEAPGLTERPAVTVAQMDVADRSLPVYTYAAAEDADRWTVARAALGEGGARWLPVRRPAAYAAEVFASLAAAQGIALGAGQPIDHLPQGTVIVAHESAPLRDILRDMLFYSTNLTAEAVGLSATARRQGIPPDLASSAAAMNAWLSDTYGISASFVDHSGLSDRSRITAAEMAVVLAHDGSAETLAPLLKTIPLTNDAHERIEDFPAAVNAKTGTLNFVSGLAGYLTEDDGANFAFAIFAADFDRRASGIASGEEIPDGARPWNARTRRLQQDLLQRWGVIYTR